MTLRPPVRKAVIPAAGLGTRCLPLTKAVPKELLPILDRPGLELIVDEAIASGIDTMVLVTSKSKPALLQHFSPNPSLESKLADKPALLSSIQRLQSSCRVVATYQENPRGLGHAVGCGEEAVGDEPFAVMLPDDLVFDETPALKRLTDVYEATGKGVVLLMEVPREDTRRYGVVESTPQADGTLLIHDMVEKPDPADAPSNWAIVGRYMFPPGFCQRIRNTEPGTHNEIQLTDAMRALAQDEGMIGVPLTGDRIDTGSPNGLFQASLYLAARNPTLRPLIQDMLTQSESE